MAKESTDIEKFNLKQLPSVRLYLIVLIVLIHSFCANNHPITSNLIVQEYFSQVIARVAVPIYFFISGFLFFHNVQTIVQWKKKILRRLKTLVIPYLIWNLGYGICLILISEIDIDTLYSIIHHIFITPAINPLWFIRDLIILQILSFIYLFLPMKNNHFAISWYIFFLFIIYLLFIRLPFLHINTEGILYFTLGASKMIVGNKYLEKIGNRNYLLYFFIMISVINLLNHTYLTQYTFVIHRVANYLMSVVAIFLFLSTKTGYNIPNLLKAQQGELTFYIFALHFPIIQLIRKIFDCHSFFDYLFLFLSSLIISILIGKILARFYTVSNFLTGNRA